MKTNQKTFGDYIMYVTELIDPMLALCAWRDFLAYKRDGTPGAPISMAYIEGRQMPIPAYSREVMRKQIRFRISDDLYYYFVSQVTPERLNEIRTFIKTYITDELTCEHL